MSGRHRDTEQTDSHRGQAEATDPLCQSRQKKYGGAESDLDDWVGHDRSVLSSSNPHNASFHKTAFGYTIGRSSEGIACILI